MSVVDRVVTTDVLCVGGSGAGVTAAIYAARRGVQVALVSKGKTGYSGNAIMAGGGFGIDGESAYGIGWEQADRSFTQDKMFDCIVKESYYIADQNMVAQYVEEAPVVVQEYLGWAQRGGQDFVFLPRPATWLCSGIGFTRTLLQGLRETTGIDRYDDVTIIELLTRDGVVVGALGLDIYTGELIQFNAKAVVLGTGGYQPFSMKNTVSDMTGDGVAMGYRVGARLTDMEFMLAFPTAVVPQDMKGSIYPFVMEFNMQKIPFTVRDKNGDALPIPPDIVTLTRGTKLSKLVSSYYMGSAADDGLAGPNGGLFYDYSEHPLALKQEQFAHFYSIYDRWHKHGYYKGDDLTRVERMIYEDVPLEVGLGFEYCMGGLEVNERMEAGVPGLFAAGEVTSGVFGACRAGDGLTEMLCQGMRAGLTAADFAKHASGACANEDEAERHAEKMLGIFEHTGGPNALTLYNEIEAACDEGFSVVRWGDKLEASLARIRELRELWPTVTVNNKSRVYNNEWQRAIAAENLLVCCEAGIRAALERGESRGCHIRRDKPVVDHDNYLHKYVFSQQSGAMHMTTRKPVVTKLQPPGGTAPTVIEYFLDPALHYSR